MDWQNEVNRIRNWMTGNGNALIAALRAEGYYPSNNPATFSQRGGNVSAGFNLKLTNPNSGGTIYYTTDGSDLRVAGGASPAPRRHTRPRASRSTRSPACASGPQWHRRVERIDEATFVVANSAPVITQQPTDRTVGRAARQLLRGRRRHAAAQLQMAA